MNKSNWTEEDMPYGTYVCPQCKRELSSATSSCICGWPPDEIRLIGLKDEIEIIKSIPTNEKYRIFKAVLLSYDERFKLDLEW